MGELQGIDVAKWQGNIDWKKVAKSKQFAIIKVTNKSNKPDDYFERNYKGASENGLKIGVYRYVYAKTVLEARLEAEAVINTLHGRPLPYGIWLDMEEANIRNVGKNVLTDIINTEASIFIANGYGVGIYCNKSWYDKVLDSARLKNSYPFWIARYPSNDVGSYNPLSSLLSRTYSVACQYSSKGKVDGIVGNVDLDVAFEDLTNKMAVRQSNLYYPKYTGSSVSIIKALETVGEKDTSLAHRKKIGSANGITNIGSASSNLKMLALLKEGILIKV